MMSPFTISNFHENTAQNVLNFCTIKRWPPIFQTINNENMIFLHSSEYGGYSHSLDNLYRYIFPMYVPKSRFSPTDDIDITRNCH